MRSALIALAVAVSAAPLQAKVTLQIGAPPEAGRSLPLSVQIQGSGGYELGGISPRAWLVPDAKGACTAPASGIGAIELTGERLIVFHDDGTASAVDPARNLASSNIAWLRPLPVGYDAWLIDRKHAQLIVAQPDDGSVHRISLADGRTTAVHNGVGRVRHLVAAAEIDAVWAIDSSRAYVLHPDGSNEAYPLAGTVSTATWIGHRRLLTVAGKAAGLQFLDDQGKMWHADTPIAVTAMAASPLADTLYALSATQRKIQAIPLETIRQAAATGSSKAANIDLPGAASHLHISPKGRWLFAWNTDGLVQVIDVVNNRLSHALHIHAGISDIAFSDHYLYLHERDRPFVTMLQLASLATPQEHVIAIPAGVQGTHGTLTSLGPDGMAFLNRQERTAFLYMESGMSDSHGTMRSPEEMFSPYAAIKLRGGAPQHIAVHDRGLKPTGPGHFTTRIQPPYGGAWRVVAGDPRSGDMGCLDIAVAGNTADTQRPNPPALRLRHDPAHQGLALRLVDDTGNPPGMLPATLSVLAFSPGINWQQELTTHPREDGRYVFNAQLPPDRVIAVIPLDPGIARDNPIMIRNRP